MGRCCKCKKKIGFEYMCGHCKCAYCAVCRLPEDHACISLNSLVNTEKERLAKVLQSAASEDSHHCVKW